MRDQPKIDSTRHLAAVVLYYFEQNIAFVSDASASRLVGPMFPMRHPPIAAPKAHRLTEIHGQKDRQTDRNTHRHTPGETQTNRAVVALDDSAHHLAGSMTSPVIGVTVRLGTKMGPSKATLLIMDRSVCMPAFRPTG